MLQSFLALDSLDPLALFPHGLLHLQGFVLLTERVIVYFCDFEAKLFERDLLHVLVLGHVFELTDLALSLIVGQLMLHRWR